MAKSNFEKELGKLEKIAEELERATSAWRRPWKSMKLALPPTRNARKSSQHLKKRWRY